MTWLLLAHAVAAIGAPWLVRTLGRRAFWILALAPAATAVWALVNTEAAHSATPPTQSWTWIGSLNLKLSFVLDPLAWLMCLVVGGVGAAVLIYCSGYFSDDEPRLGQFAGCLTAFAGAMLGLVTTDDLLVLFVFWEATTVLSYLLIGHKPETKSARSAATEALVVTTFGGLAMLLGIILIGQQAGTYQISELLAQPPSGPVVAAGVVCILIGALSKSAQVPFHFWLPGAMAAPTPVSAYLHAAAMVKAGIYLIARLAPGFADQPVWLPVILAIGGATMIIGAWRALRQYDLKLLLAYGTVSQLGFLTIMSGTGTYNGGMTALTLLLAHALFKACLFLAVGTIDHTCDTRDLRELSGVGRRAPVLTVAILLALASMAGVPPLLGFVSKEMAYDTWFTAASEGGGPGAVVVLVVLVLGSVLTFAYSARFALGALTRKQGIPDTPFVHAPAGPLIIVPAVLALLSLFAGPASEQIEPFLVGYAAQMPSGEHDVHLGLWHGFSPALGLSVLTIALGLGLVAGRAVAERVQRRLQFVPSAEWGYRLIMRSLDRLSLEVTGGVQRGSLPLSLGLILGTLVVLLGATLAFGGVTWPEEISWFAQPGELGLAAVDVVAAVAAARSRRRFRGVFAVGVAGYATALFFVLHGAPDLGLTQVLVETFSLVVLVLVLRRFSGRFNDDTLRRTRVLRAGIGIAVGVTVTLTAITASTVRRFSPASVGLEESAPDFGGGYNIVNVILVDARAWDTMGELSVVLVAATGIASLIYLRGNQVFEHNDRLRKARANRRHYTRPPSPTASWLAAGGHDLSDERRSVVFEVVTRLVFHSFMMWSIYLLFAGHNLPGGGFAAGLVAGLALTVRYLAGGRAELRAAAPVTPGLLLGAGLFLSAGFGLVSILIGGAVLQTWDVYLDIPLLGEVHLVSSVVFDLGVYLVVIGLALDILRSLGGRLDVLIERQAVRLLRRRGAGPGSSGTAEAVAGSSGTAEAASGRPSSEHDEREQEVPS